MSNLTPQELTKVRKAAIQSVTLSSDTKSSVVDAKLREFATEIKKVLVKKNASVEVLLVNF